MRSVSGQSPDTTTSGHAASARGSPRLPAPSAQAATVADLLVGIAIAAILVSAATPRLATWLAVLRLPAGAARLAADLSVARATAVLRDVRARVTFTAEGYSVWYGDAPSPEVFRRLPPGVHVVSLPASGALRFFPSGRAENGTVALAAATGARRSVIVNQRGRVVVR